MENISGKRRKLGTDRLPGYLLIGVTALWMVVECHV